MNSRNVKLTPEQVPYIPQNLTPEQYSLVVPQGFEDLITHEVDLSNPHNPCLLIHFLTPENPLHSSVKINRTLLNAKDAEVVVPKFLFEKSSVSQHTVQYFGADKHQVLNINQVIYLVLQHRMVSYVNTLINPTTGNKRKQYTNLLASDISRLSQCIQYTKPNTFNAIQRLNNTYVILSYDMWSSFTLGEIVNNAKPNEKQWSRIMSDLSGHVRATSESSLSSSGKLVLVENKSDPLYRSVGYALNTQSNSQIWICASKQNIPARQKSHILSDAYKILDPATSCFQQDNLYRNGVTTRKDDTLREAVVVFHPMNQQSSRFIAGELEVTSNIADTLVQSQKSLNVQFKDEQSIHIVEGGTYEPDEKDFVLGIDVDDQNVVVSNAKSIHVKHMSVDSKTGTYKVVMNLVFRAGNARILSSTGLKGVTKVKVSNGTVFFPKESDMAFDLLSFDTKDALSQYDAENSYRTVNLDDFADNWKPLSVDIVAGMNAVKAKSNTIALAQAALAVKLGYYKPVSKGPNKEYEGVLNTLDANEINEAANALPEFVYVNEFGVPVKCYVGLVYINYTELGTTYAKWKEQTFAFEAGHVIQQNCPELYQHIMENYLETDKTEVAKELYTILKDTNCILAKEDELPFYTAEQIRDKKVFTVKDLVLSKTSTFPSLTKLLDEEFNSKGFVINLKKHKGPMIRIPSAKTLQTFVGTLPNGEYMYHQVIVNVSKIIQAILGIADIDKDDPTKMSLRPRFEWIFNKYDDDLRKTKHYPNYLSSLHGVVFSSENQSQVYAQAFVKPKIPGFGLKQMIETFLPDNVVVVFNKKLIRKAYKQTGYVHLNERLGMPAIDVEYLKTFKGNKLSQRKLVDKVLFDDVPMVGTFRHPFLWDSQCLFAHLWDVDRFAIYLKYYHNLDIKKYLDVRYNSDIAFLSPNIVFDSKSDVDGDLIGILCFNSEGTKLIKTFKLNSVLKEEKQWLIDYKAGEYETTFDLKLDGKHTYQLFNISNTFDITGVSSNNYPQYLLNAAEAKAAVG